MGFLCNFSFWVFVFPDFFGCPFPVSELRFFFVIIHYADIEWFCPCILRLFDEKIAKLREILRKGYESSLRITKIAASAFLSNRKATGVSSCAIG